jgi:hypothetical protein
MKRRVFAGILGSISKKHNVFRAKIFRRLPKLYLISASLNKIILGKDRIVFSFFMVKIRLIWYAKMRMEG